MCGSFVVPQVASGGTCRRRSRVSAGTAARRLDTELARRSPWTHGRPPLNEANVNVLLEETISVLSNADVVRALQAAEAAVADGDVVRGVDAVRALRRPTGR